MTKRPNPAAVALLDQADKTLQWTTALGRWQHHRDYMLMQRGIVRHSTTRDQLAEFVYPADAEHAVRWQPKNIEALIARDRATLERHRSDPQYDDGACSCGWNECPEVAAILEFWTAVLTEPDATTSDTEGPAPVFEPPAEMHAANGKGITVGELIEFLRQHNPDLQVAAACGCSGKGGWSSTAKSVYLASGTATSNEPHLKIGWGGGE